MEVSKSIWDVRFAPRKMALDAACKDALAALDEWITINGAHVELNDKGEIINGAGGRLRGGNYAQAKAARQERIGENSGNLKLKGMNGTQIKSLSAKDAKNLIDSCTQEQIDGLLEQAQNEEKAAREQVDAVRNKSGSTQKDVLDAYKPVPELAGRAIELKNLSEWKKSGASLEEISSAKERQQRLDEVSRKQDEQIRQMDKERADKNRKEDIEDFKRYERSVGKEEAQKLLDTYPDYAAYLNGGPEPKYNNWIDY